MYKKGDIVLVPFPFTDLTATKTRPALVVSESNYEMETGNVIIAMITSMPQTTVYDYEIKDWQGANLLLPSWVRIKLATIEPSLVRHRIGSLRSMDLREVQIKILSALAVNR
ncbi:MAG: type II toxin-antitoxin system PemK/MazF family toxin [Nitrospirae bacterium]|nr:type II toxin-antitoxin system PemK/MazF family toxin [Nitrospirota bacterium]